MFLFQVISELLISITFYTYLANIVFRATWPLNSENYQCQNSTLKIAWHGANLLQQ